MLTILMPQSALKREEELTRFEIPLLTQEMRNGYPHRHWVLWDDRPCTLLRSFREVTRNLRQKCDGYFTYTALEVRRMYALPKL